MPTQPNTKTAHDRSAELQRAIHGKQAGLFRQYWQFLREEKKWWLAPILLLLLLSSGLILAGGTAIGPFIYALF
jgi:hypothetical protein